MLGVFCLAPPLLVLLLLRHDGFDRSNNYKPKWPKSNTGGKKKYGAKYVQVSAGYKHTCALVDNGSYECIGNDASGRSYGHKPKWPSSNPNGENKDGAKYVQVSAGHRHTCALVNDGSYECIGHDGSSRSNRYKPKWPKSNPGGKKKDGEMLNREGKNSSGESARPIDAAATALKFDILE